MLFLRAIHLSLSRSLFILLRRRVRTRKNTFSFFAPTIFFPSVVKERGGSLLLMLLTVSQASKWKHWKIMSFQRTERSTSKLNSRLYANHRFHFIQILFYFIPSLLLWDRMMLWLLPSVKFFSVAVASCMGLTFYMLLGTAFQWVCVLRDAQRLSLSWWWWWCNLTNERLNKNCNNNGKYPFFPFFGRK